MGALLDAVPAGGADHTEHHRDLATAVEAAATTAAVAAGYQPLDSDLTAIAALSTTAYGRSLLTLANQAALQAEAGGSALTPGVDYPTSATVTLSSADILDLHNTPVTLVAAPGAGKYLVFHKADGHLSYGTTAYTTGGSGLLIAYGAAAGDIFATLGTGDASADTIYRTTEDGSHAAADIVNEPLVLATDAAFADGDGTLTVTVWYTVEDVPA